MPTDAAVCDDPALKPLVNASIRNAERSEHPPLSAAPPRGPALGSCLSELQFAEAKGCTAGGDSSSAYIVSKGRKFDVTKLDVPSEDAFALLSVDGYELACLADGHGGPECSNFMVAHLTSTLRREVFRDRYETGQSTDSRSTENPVPEATSALRTQEGLGVLPRNLVSS